MGQSRRSVLKGAGYAGGAALGAKGLHEIGGKVIDILNGECETQTDTITLGPGDAARYRQDGQTYYLEHRDTPQARTEARFGPVDGSIETIDISYAEEIEEVGAELTRENRPISLYVHVNLGDAVTGGDVVEPRGFYGVSLHNIKASYDDPVCVIERGEASEMNNS